MEVRRTVSVKLDVDSDGAALLKETVEEFLYSANFVVDHAWNGDSITTSKAKLQRETYDKVRDRTPLNSGLVQNARNKAADALSSVVTRKNKGQKAGKPHFSKPTVWYDKRCATFQDDQVSLATTQGRVQVEYVLPDSIEGTPHAEYLMSEDYVTTGAELLYRDGDWFLHLRTKAVNAAKTSVQVATEHASVLGVDLGVRNLAVASTGRFWSADEYYHWRQEYEKRRLSLQRSGTRWALKNLKAVSRQEHGRITMLLHRTANEIIEEAIRYGCSVIALEDLGEIRVRTRASWGHRWAFRRLNSYIKYKAVEHDIKVVQVQPKNTSQRCSTCGFTSTNNRDAETFLCLDCGYENHSDYNAAKNIGLRYLRRDQTGPVGGAPLGVRLNSQILSANGDLLSTPSSEDTAEINAETNRTSGR